MIKQAWRSGVGWSCVYYSAAPKVVVVVCTWANVSALVCQAMFRRSNIKSTAWTRQGDEVILKVNELAAVTRLEAING